MHAWHMHAHATTCMHMCRCAQMETFGCFWSCGIHVFACTCMHMRPPYRCAQMETTGCFKEVLRAAREAHREELLAR